MNGEARHGYQLVSGSEDLESETMPTRDRYNSTVTNYPSESMAESRSVGLVILSSVPFQSLTALTILANGLVIGLETDLPHLAPWDIFEQVFLILFTSELVFKLSVLGCREYFKFGSTDFSWNVFDVIVVSIGVFDVVLALLGVQERNGSAATVFRMIRILRILRIFRIVRFLRQLYLLAAGFALAAVAVFWVTCLMGFLLYVCSIMLVRTIGRSDQNDLHHDFLMHRFGSIPKSMFSLFIAMINPDILPYEDVMYEYPMFSVFLIAFIIFGSLGLIAVVTGVIMECMFEKNDLRKEMERQELEVSRLALVQTCDEMFEYADHNEFGDVAIRDMRQLFDRISETFKARGVLFAKSDVKKMIKVLDVDGSGTVSKPEFNQFIQYMVEGVTPMMVMEILHSVKSVQKKLDGAVRGTRPTPEEQQPCNSINLEPLMREMSASITAELQAYRSELGQTLANVIRKEVHCLASDRCESAMSVTNAIRTELHLTAAAIRKELQIQREEDRMRMGVTSHWDVDTTEARSLSQSCSPSTSTCVSDRLEALKSQMHELMVSQSLSPDLCEYIHAANLCIHSIQQLRSLQAISEQDLAASHLEKDLSSRVNSKGIAYLTELPEQPSPSFGGTSRSIKVRTPRSNPSIPTSPAVHTSGIEFDALLVQPPPLTPPRGY